MAVEEREEGLEKISKQLESLMRCTELDMLDTDLRVEIIARLLEVRRKLDERGSNGERNESDN